MKRSAAPLLFLAFAFAVASTSGAALAASSGASPSSSSPARETAASDPLARRVDALFSDYTQSASPGLAVAVVRDGQVLLRRGYGLACLEHKVPITPSTVFDLASVAKQFAGFAVATLVEDGKISLSDDIRKYIPELPDFGPVITIDHLVHHTSGLRDWPGTLAIAGWRMDDVISFDQIRAMAFGQKALNFAPGSEYAYSNTGYNMLAEMVARVTGRSFRRWTDERIFRPLGMADTRFRDDHTEVVPRRASGYGRGEGGAYKAVADNLTAPGSSSLFSTVDDLAKWMLNFDAPVVGGPAVLRRMGTPGVLNDGRPNSYAFGLMNGDYRGIPTLHHAGQWAAFNTFVMIVPGRRLGIAVLANSDAIDAARAANKVAALVLEKELVPPSPSAAGAPAGGGGPEAAPVEVAPALLDDCAGVYRLGPGWYVTVRRDGSSLKARASGEDEVPMTARSAADFWVSAYKAAIVFERDAAGRVSAFRYRGRVAPKLAAGAPSRTISDYAGTYVSDELGTAYRVEARDGALVMVHRRHGTIRLTPAHGEDYRGSEWFLASVEFRRDAAGKVDGLLVNAGERVRDVRFRKAD